MSYIHAHCQMARRERTHFHWHAPKERKISRHSIINHSVRNHTESSTIRPVFTQWNKTTKHSGATYFMLTEQGKGKKKKPFQQNYINKKNKHAREEKNIQLSAVQSSATQPMPVEHYTVKSHTTGKYSRW